MKIVSITHPQAIPKQYMACFFSMEEEQQQRQIFK